MAGIPPEDVITGNPPGTDPSNPFFIVEAAQRSGFFEARKHHQEHLQSAHAKKNATGCITCHSPHATAAGPKPVKAAGSCKGCHGNALNDLDKAMPGTGSTAGNLLVRSHAFNPNNPRKGGPTATGLAEPQYDYRKWRGALGAKRGGICRSFFVALLPAAPALRLRRSTLGRARRVLSMPVTPLPAEHPLRRALADELHARPPAPVRSPAVVSCMALLDAPAGEILAALRGLLGDEPAAADDVAHIIFERAQLRVKWERHGEFVSLTLVRPLTEAALAALDRFPSAFGAFAGGELARLPGRLIAAADIVLLPAADSAPGEDELARWFDRSALAGARILDGAAWVFTDFVVHAEGEGGGRSRWLLLDAGMSAPQTARLVQRVIEIEVYRMMALLAFPLARSALPQLNAIEQRLAEITSATAALHGQQDVIAAQLEERRLLDELTRLAAEVERSVAATAFRFSAAQAYWDLASSRVRELREVRIGDRRTIAGFLSRRLAPAMNSCAAAARRQEELSARIERASALLRTRVDVAREEQNQQLLAAMERRGKISLRLQQTVEGLSVAAITYYAAGLIGYLVKPLKSLWPALNPDWVVAAAIPLLAFGVWRAVHRLRRELMRE